MKPCVCNVIYSWNIRPWDICEERSACDAVVLWIHTSTAEARLALSQEQKRKIQTLEINVPPHSRREKPAPDGLPIKFRSINTKNQSDTFLIRNDPKNISIWASVRRRRPASGAVRGMAATVQIRAAVACTKWYGGNYRPKARSFEGLPVHASQKQGISSRRCSRGQRRQNQVR